MAEKLCAPFLHGADEVRLRMADAAAALLPAAAGAVWFWRWRALALLAGCCGGCAALEWLCARARPGRGDVRDGSALVTGLLLALLLPASCPWWAAAAAVFAAIVPGKRLFGGLGRNPLNPAAFGRAALLLVPALRPAALRTASGTFLLGYTGGSLGELSSALLLLGAVYLAARRLLPPETAVPALLAAFFTGLVLPGCDAAAVAAWGGTLLAAAFLASDPVTSPMRPGPRLLYGACAGAGCTLLAYYGWGIGGTACGILAADVLGRLADLLPPPKKAK